MSTAADTLVSKFSTREAQLRGPVLQYFLKESKTSRGPFTPLPQDLYLATFYPAYRKKSPDTQFPDRVKHDNPGINTVADYVKKANAVSLTSWKLTPQEEQALKETAAGIGVSRDTLYRLIGFESGWNPKARNPVSGARGLIQFIPSTAEGMGFKAGISILPIAIAVAAFFFFRRKKS